MAVGDETGKIYNIVAGTGGSNTIIQTLHWHASAVASLKFVANTPFLISGGQEAVLVQWHLEKQDRTFVARVGQAIKTISLSSTYYALVLADNSLKVARFDNNKVSLDVSNLDLTGLLTQVSNSNEALLVPTADSTTLQSIQLN